MGANRYIFDASQGRFRKSVTTLHGFVLGFFKVIFAASALAVIWYLLFALFLNTDVEKTLLRENRAYKAEYQRFEEDVILLEAVVASLELRDDAIYDGIFRNSVRSMRAHDAFSPQEELPVGDMDLFISRKLNTALKGAEKVDADFRKLFGLLDKGAVLPPLTAPIEGFSVKMAGASAGMRYSPFLGTDAWHSGLDIIASSGTPVRAGADGTVVSVERSIRGKGNVVSIAHAGTFVTRYANLGSIKVRSGERVRRGEVIGTVGMSGLSYVPHLHYEVLRGDIACDPSQFLSASLTPEQYVELQLVASETGQSLD